MEAPMVLWLASCGLVGVPSASVQNVALTQLGMSEAGVQVTVGVDNPMWVDLHVEGLRWSLNVASHTIGRGEAKQPAVLTAGEVSPIDVPVRVQYAALWGALGDSFSGSEVPYRLSLELDTVTPTGLMTVPLIYEGALPPLRAPSIDIIHLDWEVEPDGRLRIDLGIDLGLPEQFGITRLDWTVDVDGRVLGSGALDAPGDGVIRFPVRLDPVGAAEASWDWLWGSSHELRLVLDGAIGTPLGTVPLSTRASLALSNERPE